MGALASVAGLSLGVAGLAAASPAKAAGLDTVTYFNANGALIGTQIIVGFRGGSSCTTLAVPTGTASLQYNNITEGGNRVYTTSSNCTGNSTYVPSPSLSGMISDTSGLGSVYGS